MFALRSLYHGNIKKVQKDYWLALFGVVLPIISITPFAAAYVFYICLSAAKRWSHRHLPTWLHICLSIYALCELLTFVSLLIVWLRARRPLTSDKLQDSSLQLCETIRRVMSLRLDEDLLSTGSCSGSEAEDAEEEEAARFRRKFSGWFFKRPFHKIPRGNAADWLAWSTFNKHLHAVHSEEAEVIESLLSHLERRARQTLKPGFNKRVKSIRLTLDPIPFVPRPLLFYLVVGLLNAHARFVLRRLGCKLRKATVSDYDFEYFYRPPAAGSTQTPLLFLHGLGMGVAQYLRFIKALEKAFPGRELFLLAQGQISMLPTHRHWLRPPTRAATVALFAQLAQEHEVAKRGGWTVLSHSFGSIPHAWLLKDLPHYTDTAEGKQVGPAAAVHVLVDPVCFRLWESDVCYNFLYRRPRNAMQLLMTYFVGKELGISYTLHRAFFWYDNLLLPEDLHRDAAAEGGGLARDLAVYLGGRDEIIDAGAIRGYLAQTPGVRVHYYQDHGHGKLLQAGHLGGDGLRHVLQAIDRRR